MRKLDYVEGQGVHHEAIAECIGESGMSPADVARATGIALPKVLRLVGLCSGRARVCDEIDGFELIRLCLFLGLPMSAVFDGEAEPC